MRFKANLQKPNQQAKRKDMDSKAALASLRTFMLLTAKGFKVSINYFYDHLAHHPKASVQPDV